MFEAASRMKLRFTTSKGLLTTEDLWSLSLTSLDSIAKGLNKEIKDSTEESFIEVKSNASKELELKFEIVKYIIKSKLNDREVRDNLAKREEEREKLQAILDKKREASLEDLSEEELLEKLNSLK